MPMMYKAGECFHSRVKRDASICDMMNKQRDQSHQKQGCYHGDVSRVYMMFCQD